MNQKLEAFVADVQTAVRDNVLGTVKEIRKDFDSVELGKSTTNVGMFYLVFIKGDKRMTAGFSKALSTSFAAGDVRASHLDSMELAIQQNAQGEDRLKVQLPAGSRRIDISGVKQEEFKKTFKLSDIQDLTELVA